MKELPTKLALNLNQEVLPTKDQMDSLGDHILRKQKQISGQMYRRTLQQKCGTWMRVKKIKELKQQESGLEFLKEGSLNNDTDVENLNEESKKPETDAHFDFSEVCKVINAENDYMMSQSFREDV